MKGGLGDRSTTLSFDCTPQQVRQTASKQKTQCVDKGAVHPNISTLNYVVLGKW